jgi:hypothetical protein
MLEQLYAVSQSDSCPNPRSKFDRLLYNNGLNGTIPESIGQLKRLSQLSVNGQMLIVLMLSIKQAIR